MTSDLAWYGLNVGFRKQQDPFQSGLGCDIKKA